MPYMGNATRAFPKMNISKCWCAHDIPQKSVYNALKHMNLSGAAFAFSHSNKNTIMIRLTLLLRQTQLKVAEMIQDNAARQQRTEQIVALHIRQRIAQEQSFAKQYFVTT